MLGIFKVFSVILNCLINCCGLQLLSCAVYNITVSTPAPQCVPLSTLSLCPLSQFFQAFSDFYSPHSLWSTFLSFYKLMRTCGICLSCLVHLCNIMSSSSVHVAENDSTLSSFMAELYSILYKHHILINQLLVSRHLS